MSYLIEDDGSELIVVDEIDRGAQSLWVRVGPVFHENTAVGTGVWISYQENHMAGPLSGPVLLTPETWRELSRAVESRLTRKRRWRLWRL